jgi:hypothetical protein
VGHCQTSTVAALLKKAPDLKLKDNFYGRAARLAAHAAGCGEVVSLIAQADPTSLTRKKVFNAEARRP